MVVDNSPGDGTGDIVRAQFPAVTYLAPETNLGFGRANNLGYARSRGDSAAPFLNPDTVSNAAALAHCVARLQADERIGLISPRLELADGTMDLACRRSIPNLRDGFCRASGLAWRFRAWALAGGAQPHAPPADRHLRGRRHQRRVHAGAAPGARGGRAGRTGV